MRQDAFQGCLGHCADLTLLLDDVTRLYEKKAARSIIKGRVLTLRHVTRRRFPGRQAPEERHLYRPPLLQAGEASLTGMRLTDAITED